MDSAYGFCIMINTDKGFDFVALTLCKAMPELKERVASRWSYKGDNLELDENSFYDPIRAANDEFRALYFRYELLAYPYENVAVDVQAEFAQRIVETFKAHGCEAKLVDDFVGGNAQSSKPQIHRPSKAGRRRRKR